MIDEPVEPVDKRALGQTGLYVSVIGFGGLALRGEPQAQPYSRNSAMAALDHAKSLGINLYDTAPGYGQSEAALGNWIAEGAHNDVVVATKCGCICEPIELRCLDTVHDFTRSSLLKGLLRSLKRLQLGKIAIIQLHVPPPEPPPTLVTEIIPELESWKRRGIIRAIGVSCETPIQAWKYASSAHFDVVQLPVSPLDKLSVEVAEQLVLSRIGVIARDTMALRAGFGAPGPGLDEDNWESIDGFREGLTRRAYCLKSVLALGVSSVLVGTLSLEHLDDAAEWSRIDESL